MLSRRLRAAIVVRIVHRIRRGMVAPLQRRWRIIPGALQDLRHDVFSHASCDILLHSIDIERRWPAEELCYFHKFLFSRWLLVGSRWYVVGREYGNTGIRVTGCGMLDTGEP